MYQPENHDTENSPVMKNITIRLAEPSQVFSILYILKEVIKGENNFVNYTFDPEDINTVVADKNQLIAFHLGVTAGVLSIKKEGQAAYEQVKTYQPSKALFLHSLGVHPVYRKKGIATALVQFALEYTAQLKAEIMYTDVSSKNTAAKALFLKRGFTEEGQFYFSDTNHPYILLRKNISPH